MPIHIDENFCYNPEIANVKATQEALEYSEQHKLNNTQMMDGDIPIVLDTNILLQLYKMSKAERDSFLKFLDKNSGRIIITGQVNKEYLAHRALEIRKLKKSLQSLKSEITKWFDDFVASKKKILDQMDQFTNRSWVKDMQLVRGRINDFKKHVEDSYPADYFKNAVTLSNIVNETLSMEMEVVERKAASEESDEVLKAISKAIILDPRTQEELEFLDALYHERLIAYEPHKTDKENKDLYTFPGSGDWRKEKDGFSPIGDFIIYHEMLAYMKDKNTDLCFLTNDITKSDWVNSTDRNPFLQYVIDVHRNTGHMINFVNAEQFTTLTFNAVENDDDEFDGHLISEVADVLVKELTEEGTEADKPATTVVNQTVEIRKAESSEEVVLDEQEEEVAETKPTSTFYQDIDVEEFMNQLAHYIKWNDEYEHEYPPTQEYFIKYYLGRQKFHYSASYKKLRELVRAGLVEVYEEELHGRKVKCLRIVNSGSS